ncbi:hypothetical protein FKM82_017563 [Ascaphus truei]
MLLSKRLISAAVVAQYRFKQLLKGSLPLYPIALLMQGVPATAAPPRYMVVMRHIRKHEVQLYFHAPKKTKEPLKCESKGASAPKIKETYSTEEDSPPKSPPAKSRTSGRVSPTYSIGPTLT